MSKAYSDIITLNVQAAAGGASSPLKQAIQAFAFNQGGAFINTSWPADGTRLNYTDWSHKMVWDRTNKRIVTVDKRQNGGAGALHWYTDSTNAWTQKWTGQNNATNSGGHPYSSWALDQTTGSVWWIDWAGGMRRWEGPSNTSANWELVFTPTGSQFAASGSDGPHAIGFIPNWWGSGQTGLIMVKRSNSASGRFNAFKLDGTSATNFWTGAGITSEWKDPQLVEFPYYTGLLAVETQGHLKTGSAFENPSSRTAGRSCSMWIIKGTSASPSVTRLPDPPSSSFFWGTGDRFAVYKQYIYLFSGNSLEWWILDTTPGGVAIGWVQGNTSSTFNPFGSNYAIQLCPIEEYGGIVSRTQSGVSGSENVAGSPIYAIKKVETVA